MHSTPVAALWAQVTLRCALSSSGRSPRSIQCAYSIGKTSVSPWYTSALTVPGTVNVLDWQGVTCSLALKKARSCRQIPAKTSVSPWYTNALTVPGTVAALVGQALTCDSLQEYAHLSAPKPFERPHVRRILAFVVEWGLKDERKLP